MTAKFLDVDLDKKTVQVEIDGKTLTKTEKDSEWLYRNLQKPNRMLTWSEYLLFLKNSESAGKLIEQEQQQMRLAPIIGKIEGLPEELFDLILERKLELGYDPQRIKPIVERVEAKKLKNTEQEKLGQIESEKQMLERSKFPVKFLRLCGYLTIKQYHEELEQDINKATFAEVEEARSLLLKGEKPELTTEQRSYALTWLNSHHHAEPDESPKSLARKLLDLTRGH